MYCLRKVFAEMLFETKSRDWTVWTSPEISRSCDKQRPWLLHLCLLGLCLPYYRLTGFVLGCRMLRRLQSGWLKRPTVEAAMTTSAALSFASTFERHFHLPASVLPSTLSNFCTLIVRHSVLKQSAEFYPHWIAADCKSFPGPAVVWLHSSNVIWLPDTFVTIDEALAEI